jgi:hypothetical protein
MSDVRQAFAAFVEQDQLVKWYVAINGANRVKKRFFFWQERLWDRFVDTYPAYKFADFDAILAWFHYCHLHDQPLELRKVKISYGTVNFSRWYLRHRDDYSPYAAVAHGPCWKEPETPRDVPVCSTCDAAFNLFNKRSRGDP